MGVVVQSNITVTTGTQTEVPALQAGTASLVVTVTDSTNGPVPEAAVWVRPVALSSSLCLATGARTDLDGVVSFPNLVPGDYAVSVDFRGLAREVRTLSIPDSGASLDIQMQAARTVSGWVRDEGNAMLYGHISAQERNTGEVHMALVDPSSGHYTLDTLSDGIYDLYVFDTKHAPAFFEGISVSNTIPTRTLNATLLTTATTLTGRVTDPAGTPVCGAEVALKNAWGIPFICTNTGSEGAYALGPIAQGDWDVSVSVPGFQPVSRRVTFPGTGEIQEDFQLGPLMGIAISAKTVGHFSQPTVLANAASVDSSPSDLSRSFSPGMSGTRVWAHQSAAVRWGADSLGIQPPEWPYSDDWLRSYTKIKITRWCEAWSDAYDEAVKSELALTKAYDNWVFAYEALDSLAGADMGLALSKGSLIGAKTVKLLWGCLSGKAGGGKQAKDSIQKLFNVGESGADIILFGTDRAVDILATTGKACIAHDFDGVELMGDQLAKSEAFFHDWVFKYGAKFGNGYLSKGYAAYGIYKDYGKWREEMDEMLKNDLPVVLSAYAEAQEQFLTLARQHHANMRAVQAGADYCQDGKGNKPKKPLPKPKKKKKEDKKKIPKKGSVDPNEKGTVGFGAGGFVQPDGTLVFTIHFENQTTASAKAQQVTIADRLDANLDWSTFEVMQVAFANTSVAVPAGLRSYQTETTVENDPNPVRINVALNTFSGTVNWTIQSVDPVTGGVPEDPLAGFLPPNDATHVGEGYVTYRVSPKAGLPDGTVIQNQASIVFDANAPILTNTTLNTLDGQAPKSEVDALPESVDAHFLVTWSGTDGGEGAGVASYDLYVQKDEEVGYQLWLEATTATQAVYLGGAAPCVSFFYSVARDWVGNVEPIPAQPDAVTTVHEWLPPTGVEASDGEFLESVRVTWNPVPLTYYRVFRSTSPSGEWQADQRWIADPTFTDSPPEPLVTYFYAVQMAGEALERPASGLSEADGGWASLRPMTVRSI
jgi:hypothetical protein